MQTFLPYPNFIKSAKCLDNKRLGKQRIEAWQIYKALTEENYGWKNHPAIKMWKGYEKALLVYGAIICEEWISRGFKDTMYDRFNKELRLLQVDKQNKLIHPHWFHNPEFHASHRSNLLRKDPMHYGQFGWTEPDDLQYVWSEK